MLVYLNATFKLHRYLARFDEELADIIDLDKSTNRRNHAAREDLLVTLKKQEKEQYVAGFGMLSAWRSAVNALAFCPFQ